jgi:hypothetical protein
MNNRRHFLRSTISMSASLYALMALGGPRRARAQAAPKRKLLLVTCNGGWDVSFHLDPKPVGLATIDVPAGNIVTNGDLSWMSAVANNGVVDNFMTAHQDVASIVRGISVRSISHDVCIRRMLTGSPSEDAPDMGVITAHTHAPDLAAPYLTLGAVSFPGTLEGASVRMGQTNQLALALRYADIAPEIGAQFPTASERSLIDQFLVDEGNKLAATRGQHGKNAKKAGDFLSSIDRVNGLSANQEFLGDPFSLALSLDEQFQNALTMLEGGLTWAVNVSTGFVWDHHDPGQAPTGTYDGAQGVRNQTLWPALTTLVDELKVRPGTTPGSKMIDETVVVVLSEMTRTPKKNAQGGKDHWPYTSALVIGGGVVPGKSFGATDDALTSRPIDLSTGLAATGGITFETSHFVATVLALCGVDPSAYVDAPVLDAILA